MARIGRSFPSRPYLIQPVTTGGPVTSSRQAPESAALLQTSSRNVPESAGLLATLTRQIPQSAA
jgi:hypothetical protein